MKILVEKAQGANLFIAKSFATAFSLIGNQVVFWDDTERSVHDIFSEFEPDIFFGHTWRLNRARINCINARPAMKVILRANHWGDVDSDIDLVKYPIGVATDEEKKNVECISKHPNFSNIICQYLDSYAEGTHNRWGDLGLNHTGIPLAVDITDYYYTQPSDKYRCHIAFAGGFWPYKSKYLSQYLLPLCYPNTELSVKIFSAGGWGTPSCVGAASEETLRNSYASATACANIFEPHSIEIPFISDINQRTFQTTACGGFQISQRATGLDQLFNEDELVMVDSPKEFLEKFIYYSQNPEERQQYINRGVKKVYREHLNLHRAAQVFSLLELPDEAAKCINKAEEIYQSVLPKLGE